jgi:hypothetical protein
VRAEPVMTCDGVRRLLRPFLEDLVSEEEHAEVVFHMDACPPCEKYIRSIGDLSNQVWKLGRIEVPADFTDTVLFKTKRQEGVPRERSGLRVHWFMGPVLAVLAVVLLFSVAAYVLERAFERSLGSAPPPVASRILIAAPAVVAPPQEEMAPSYADVAKTPARAPEAAPTASEVPPAQAVAVPGKPLHWHIAYEEEGPSVSREKIVSLHRDARTLEADLYRLEAADTPQAALDAAHRRAGELEEETRLIEEKNIASKRAAESQKTREASVRAGFLSALDAAGARRISQPSDLVVFAAADQSLEKSLESALSLADALGGFEDYTGGVSSSAGDEHQVSVYFERKGEAGLHWHVRFSADGRKESLFKAVRDLGGSVEYDAGGVLLLSVPRTELKKLRLKFQSVHAEVEEFGSADQAGNVLTNADVPVTVFIYY